MKIRKLLFTLILATFPITQAFAKLDDTIAQYNERYGAPTAQYDQGENACRFYLAGGQLRQVMFYQNKAVMEFITLAKSQPSGQEETNNTIGQSLSQLTNYLKKNYGFSDKQIEGHEEITQRLPQLFESKSLANADMSAFLEILIPDEKSMTCVAILSKRRQLFDYNTMMKFIGSVYARREGKDAQHRWESED